MATRPVSLQYATCPVGNINMQLAKSFCPVRLMVVVVGVTSFQSLSVGFEIVGSISYILMGAGKLYFRPPVPLGIMVPCGDSAISTWPLGSIAAGASAAT